MTYPQQTLNAIRGCVNDDGVLVIKDIRCSDRDEENLANPLAPMLYSLSIIYCLFWRSPKPNGAGLGTMGFNPVVAKAMTAKAGFTRFQQLGIEEDVFNYYYAARPWRGLCSRHHASFGYPFNDCTGLRIKVCADECNRLASESIFASVVVIFDLLQTLAALLLSLNSKRKSSLG